jgi:transposase-like protein
VRKRSKEEERQIVEESLESGVTVVSVVQTVRLGFGFKKVV